MGGPGLGAQGLPRLTAGPDAGGRLHGGRGRCSTRWPRRRGDGREKNGPVTLAPASRGAAASARGRGGRPAAGPRSGLATTGGAPSPPGGREARSPQLRGAGRAPLPAQPGQPLRADTDSHSPGTAPRGIAWAPGSGQRLTQGPAPRPKRARAQGRPARREPHAPPGESLRLVRAPLPPPPHAALSDAWEPAEAQSSAETCARHAPPPHGRGGHRAAIARRPRRWQGRGGRRAAQATLLNTVPAGNPTRNEKHAKAHGPCTTEDACVKRRRL